MYVTQNRNFIASAFSRNKKRLVMSKRNQSPSLKFSFPVLIEDTETSKQIL